MVVEPLHAPTLLTKSCYCALPVPLSAALTAWKRACAPSAALDAASLFPAVLRYFGWEFNARRLCASARTQSAVKTAVRGLLAASGKGADLASALASVEALDALPLRSDKTWGAGWRPTGVLAVEDPIDVTNDASMAVRQHQWQLFKFDCALSSALLRLAQLPPSPAAPHSSAAAAAATVDSALPTWLCQLRKCEWPYQAHNVHADIAAFGSVAAGGGAMKVGMSATGVHEGGMPAAASDQDAIFEQMMSSFQPFELQPEGVGYQHAAAHARMLNASYEDARFAAAREYGYSQQPSGSGGGMAGGMVGGMPPPAAYFDDMTSSAHLAGPAFTSAQQAHAMQYSQKPQLHAMRVAAMSAPHAYAHDAAAYSAADMEGVYGGSGYAPTSSAYYNAYAPAEQDAMYAAEPYMPVPAGGAPLDAYGGGAFRMASAGYASVPHGAYMPPMAATTYASGYYSHAGGGYVGVPSTMAPAGYDGAGMLSTPGHVGSSMYGAPPTGEYGMQHDGAYATHEDEHAYLNAARNAGMHGSTPYMMSARMAATERSMAGGQSMSSYGGGPMGGYLAGDMEGGAYSQYADASNEHHVYGELHHADTPDDAAAYAQYAHLMIKCVGVPGHPTLVARCDPKSSAIDDIAASDLFQNQMPQSWHITALEPDVFQSY
ncbi:MAG: hypothetical protein EOO41_00785 [Methanobacteriota archaeon]|nr:MAG: hypothetical protein EOO41_00785 [Euryarchaeota archaeon]